MVEHFKKDPILYKIIESIEPKNTLAGSGVTTDVYFALLESIVSQQLSVKASDTIFKRFVNLFESGYPHPSELIQLSTETLRSAGLSYQKAAYLKNVAQFSLSADISFEILDKMEDEEIIKLLTQIKGVGRWTVEMLLMFVMNRPDVFPYDDLVVRNNVIKLYGITETGKDMKITVLKVTESWKPYRTLACKYLWRWKDTR